ncbi:MAG TPA: hypothetical protein VNG94_07295, partial [Pyrinomonadaceae bacterium]|nr:hypothetical protein [Pyrinomonadaceae bacterium]
MSQMAKGVIRRSAGLFILLVTAFVGPLTSQGQQAKRPRAREAGIIVGILPTGPLNSITDVSGVL